MSIRFHLLKSSDTAPLSQAQPWQNKPWLNGMEDIPRAPRAWTYMSGIIYTVRFEGVNVQIVNGTGTTDGETSGTGNLIIGYNESRENLGEPVDCPDGWYCDKRGGSHMLVIGEKNNYTSDSHGGMVVGIQNETSAPFASVSGGDSNTASSCFSELIKSRPA